MEQKNKKSKLKKVGWIVGSLALTACGFVVIPPLIKKFSNNIYRISTKINSSEIDDMGPEIVRTKQEEEETENGWN